MEGSGSIVLRLGHSRQALSAAMAHRRPHDAQQLLLRRSSATSAPPPGATSAAPPDAALAVFAPCTSTLCAVVLFLRLGVVVGEAGVWASLLLVLASCLVCLLTTLSICALISDGGDAPLAATHAAEPALFAALRRSVGQQLGAALAACFFLAFAADVAFCLLSFAAAACDGVGLRSDAQLMPWNPPGAWLEAAVASLALPPLAAAAATRGALSPRATRGVLFFGAACVGASLLCCVIPTSLPVPTGINATTWANNAAPDLRAGQACKRAPTPPPHFPSLPLTSATLTLRLTSPHTTTSATHTLRLTSPHFPSPPPRTPSASLPLTSPHLRHSHPPPHFPSHHHLRHAHPPPHFPSHHHLRHSHPPPHFPSHHHLRHSHPPPHFPSLPLTSATHTLRLTSPHTTTSATLTLRLTSPHFPSPPPLSPSASLPLTPPPPPLSPSASLPLTSPHLRHSHPPPHFPSHHHLRHSHPPPHFPSLPLTSATLTLRLTSPHTTHPSPHPSPQSSFALLFVLVFPGFTGILAGSNLPAQLRTPSRSIARGSLASLGAVLLSYLLIALLLAASVDRATLRTNPFILADVVAATIKLPLAHLCVAIASLAAALSYLVAAPRVLASFAEDVGGAMLVPLALRSFSGRPTRALLASCVLVQLLLLAGGLSSLAPLASGLFLLAFCLINLLCFLAALSRADFTPTFRLYSRWSALAGFALSFVAMLAALSSSPPVAALLSLLLAALLLWRRHSLHSLLTQGLAHPSRPSPAEGLPSDAVAQRVERAAAYVHDALEGRFRGTHWAVRSHNRIRAQRLHRSLRFLRSANLCVYMIILSLFERPVWCYAAPDCGDPSQVKRFNLPVLPVAASLSIEAACILLFGVEMGLKAFYMTSRAFFASPWHLTQFLLLVLNSVFVAVQALAPAGHAHGASRGLTAINPMLRPILFVAMSRSVRRSFRCFLRVIPAVADCVLLVLVMLVVYAIAGVILFAGAGDDLSSGEASHGFQDAFQSLPQALLSLFTLLTTANFPDVMLPFYKESRASSVFFVTFLLLGLFLLMNLVLAAVIDDYKKQVHASECKARARRDEALAAAFELLDLNGNGFVDLVEFSKLLQRLHQPVFSLFDGRKNSALDTEQTMAVLQRMLEGDSALPVRGLGPAAFHECLVALKSAAEEAAAYEADEADEAEAEAEAEARAAAGEVEHARVGVGPHAALVAVPRSASFHDERMRAALVARSCRRGWRVRRLSDWADAAAAARRAARLRVRRALRSRGAVWAADALVVANVAVLLVEVELRARGEAAAMAAVEAATTVGFDVCFVCEAALSAWALGAHRYLSTLRARYAAGVACVTLVADSVSWWSARGAAGAALKAAQLLRLLRLLRLLFSFSRFEAIFGHLLRVLPSFSGLAGAMWALFAVYAQLGVALFGGLVRVDYWAPSDAEALYAYCNFNDFGSAMLTLFNLLVVNNWHDIMRVVVNLTSYWSIIYFISWYVLAVVVMFNLVIAHVLDGFFDGSRALARALSVPRHADDGRESMGGHAPDTTPPRRRTPLSDHCTSPLCYNESPSSCSHGGPANYRHSNANGGPTLEATGEVVAFA
ncbi:hypothetical protein AB1Y20_016798 [Prymnesium parvum]|uniref:EF-hand domain-containing protein n=1 Tax=Prymnesium parvum TaxID=97485 RepID=A0AB34I919_PRYPA